MALRTSPWAPRGAVVNDRYDPTSVLEMIERNGKLQPLTVRDDAAKDLACVLDFQNPNLSAPSFTVPAGPCGPPCSGQSQATLDWIGLSRLARALGFPVRA